MLVISPHTPGKFTLHKPPTLLSQKTVSLLKEKYPISEPETLNNLLLAISQGTDEFEDIDFCKQYLSTFLTQVSFNFSYLPAYFFGKHEK